MAFDAKTPLALYKANLELLMRIGALLQENRQRWTKLGVAGTDDAIQRTLAQTEKLLTTNDWTSLAAMPGDSFWKNLEPDASLRGNLETAVNNQTTFAKGLNDAFAAWRDHCADVIRSAGGTIPTTFAVTARVNVAKPPAAKKAAVKKPAAKKRAAARKPAAKKAATKKAPKKKARARR
ncbi:hypothetical protein [Dokdonella sp.]|uniref:phasin family protein n=1 Tax=Dokdonella sp. TaxID=2291710 RepID=UPI0025BB6FD2|nr:hypothetical protein [Dokdonella sp.]MBX3692882.1 hypothetical protein [Dokdonella sp.]MCW5566641.1 hypothetical protein [Dokdonella sp.]